MRFKSEKAMHMSLISKDVSLKKDGLWQANPSPLDPHPPYLEVCAK
jgi:hypothetical protein